MPRRSAPPRRRERTFDGCATCRARKVKCDGLKPPPCTPCKKRGLTCAGFEAKIQYIYYDHVSEDFCWPTEQDAQNSRSSRRPLYSEKERLLMSDVMVSATRQRSVEELIDEAERSASITSSLGYQPFNVIRPTCDQHNACQEQPRENLDVVTSTLPEQNPGLLAKDLESYSEDAFSGATSSSPEFDPTTDLALVGPSMLATGDEDSTWLSGISQNGFEQLIDMQMDSILSSSLLWNSPVTHDQTVPAQTSFLLDHYKWQMVQLFSPKGGQKPPWEILHLPSALSTLSELTVYGAASHAKVSLFYSLLAVSAFNLDRLSQGIPGASNLWWKTGDDLRVLAKREVKKSIETELTGPKKSKYKDILMSLLNMVTISVVSGRQDEARSFLLDAEHFILLRGIEKPIKSRRVNLLHQIYLFLRVIEESTHIYVQLTPTDFESHKSKSNVYLQHVLCPSLRTQATLNGRSLDDATNAMIEQELIGNIGDGQPLFEEVYGIPLRLISLLSQSTWIANELYFCDDKLDSIKRRHELMLQARDLEDAILSWSFTKIVNISDELGTNSVILHHLILAIHNALMIYFYRRVYDLNASILQPYVENVASHLFVIEQEKLQLNLIFNGIAWPGFVAATEALDPLLRQQLSTWLRSSAQSSGFRNFDVAANVAEQVWRERDLGRVRSSWIDLVHEKRMSLVMT